MIRSRAHAVAVALSLTSFAAGCTSHPLETPNPTPEQQTDLNYEVNPVRKLDILFMVDNSGSMTQEQANLKTNFPKFIQRLASLPGGLPDVHIGVVSSDVGAGGTMITGNPACNRPGGDKGRLDPANKAMACGVNMGFHYLVQSDPNTKNFTGELGTVFGCMAELGIQGCGFEHQLQSTRLALIDQFNQENNGFRRDDAYLAIIYITDEDDCSGERESELYAAGTDQYPGQTSNARCAIRGHVCGGQALPNGTEFMTELAQCQAGPGGKGSQDLIPVQDFVDFLIGKDGLYNKFPDRVLVSGIIGWPAQVAGTQYALAKTKQMIGPDLIDLAPVCTSANGEAAPGLRLKAFIDSFGENGSLHSICDGDFSPALEKIANKIAAKLNPGCILADLVDRDLTKPDIQPECQVLDRKPLGNQQYQDTAILRCDAANGQLPCWKIQAPMEQMGEAKCDDNRFRVVVERAKDMPADVGVTQVVKCATCVKAKGISGCPCGKEGFACAPGYACGDGVCAPAPL